MTNREAATIAMQEMGMTPEAIETHHRAADAKMVKLFGVGALAETNQQIKLRPGQTERDFIEYLKALAELAVVASHTAPDEYEKILADMKKRVEKKQREN